MKRFTFILLTVVVCAGLFQGARAVDSDGLVRERVEDDMEHTRERTEVKRLRGQEDDEHLFMTDEEASDFMGRRKTPGLGEDAAEEAHEELQRRRRDDEDTREESRRRDPHRSDRAPGPGESLYEDLGQPERRRRNGEDMSEEIQTRRQRPKEQAREAEEYTKERRVDL